MQMEFSELIAVPYKFAYLILNSIFQIALVIIFVWQCYRIVIKRKRTDRPGRGWIRAISQLLVLSPLVSLAFGIYIYTVLLPQDGSSSNLTALGVLLAISMVYTIGFFLLGLTIYYLFATTSKPSDSSR